MSDIFSAELDPSKPTAVALRLSARFGADIRPEDVRMLSSFRFDDPAGDVGCETHIVGVALPDLGDVIVHVPLTYRGEPLDGAADSAFITHMDHSVLGRRWVYDAAHDPVYATELLLAITDAGAAAEQFLVAEDGSRSLITKGLANVRGTGPGVDPSPAAGRVDADSAESAKVVASEQSGLPAVEQVGDRTVVRLRGAAVELMDVLDITASAEDGSEGVPGGWSVDSGQLVATWDGQNAPVTLARIVI